jgi:hypothetical protein
VTPEMLAGAGLALAAGIVAVVVSRRWWRGGLAARRSTPTILAAAAACLLLAAGTAALESGCRPGVGAGGTRPDGTAGPACLLSRTGPAGGPAGEVAREPAPTGPGVGSTGAARPGDARRAATAARSVPGPAEVGEDGQVHGQRPFLHSRHVRIACAECHGPAERHRTPVAWTARTCNACHHDPARDFACAACHQEQTYAGPRRVQATMGLTVWEAPRRRLLPFDHEDHARTGCRDCHQTPVTLAPRECSTCHVDHHRPDAVCTQCHVLPDTAVHGLEVHLTCSGSGCHSAATAQRPVLSRTFCLTCHAEQQDHYPGGNCSDCHMTPAIGSAGAGERRTTPAARAALR